MNAIFLLRKSIKPNHFGQYLLQKENSTGRKTLHYTQIQCNFTIPETTNSRLVRIDSCLPQKYQGGPVKPSPKPQNIEKCRYSDLDPSNWNNLAMRNGDSFGKKRKRGSLARIGESPTILGGLDKSVIDAVIKRNMSQIRYCYQRELANNPSLSGKIKVKFVIAKDGSVSKASIDSSTMGGAGKPVQSCIVGRFKKFKFPKPNGGIVIVKYPFILSPG